MVLGVLVTTSRHLSDIIGITKAAVENGHEVDIFVMDEGVYLLAEAGLQELVFLHEVSVSFCEVSAKQVGFEPQCLPTEIVSGSQFNNATMVRRADRVISL